MLYGGHETAIAGNHTARALFTHILVYTKSSLTEQTTPVFLDFGEAAARYQVRDIGFIDNDLDAEQIAGNVTWSLPLTVGFVKSYNLYFS